MKKYTIEPICFGYFKDFEQSKFTFSRNFGKMIQVPLLAWAVKSEDGILLVDTGSEVTHDAEIKHGLTIAPACEDRREVYAKQGIDPAEVKEIILTHLHWDHCFNLDLFPNAKIMVQRREMMYAIAPLEPHMAPYERNVTNGMPPWVPYTNRMTMLSGDCQIHEGIEVYTLPGHTKGLQGVLVDTKKGKILICSDSFPLYENFECDVAPGIHTDLEVCLATMKKAHSLTDTVLPSHDIRVLDQKVYG